ncbi:MAG: hypothetical protein ACREVE_05835 [Gammaproteobacteria bacterium]
MDGLFKIVSTLIVLMLSTTGAHSAAAASPVGLWRVTSFQEPDLAVVGSRELCFRANGRFFEVRPNPNEFFNGFWFRKGDRIRFAGTQILTVDLGFQGRTSNFGQFINNAQFAGESFNLTIRGNSSFAQPGNFTARRLAPSC